MAGATIATLHAMQVHPGNCRGRNRRFSVHAADAYLRGPLLPSEAN